MHEHDVIRRHARKEMLLMCDCVGARSPSPCSISTGGYTADGFINHEHHTLIAHEPLHVIQRAQTSTVRCSSLHVWTCCWRCGGILLSAVSTVERRMEKLVWEQRSSRVCFFLPRSSVDQRKSLAPKLQSYSKRTHLQGTT